MSAARTSGEHQHLERVGEQRDQQRRGRASADGDVHEAGAEDDTPTTSSGAGQRADAAGGAVGERADERRPPRPATRAARAAPRSTLAPLGRVLLGDAVVMSAAVLSRVVWAAFRPLVKTSTKSWARPPAGCRAACSHRVQSAHPRDHERRATAVTDERTRTSARPHQRGRRTRLHQHRRRRRSAPAHSHMISTARRWEWPISSSRWCRCCLSGRERRPARAGCGVRRPAPGRRTAPSGSRAAASIGSRVGSRLASEPPPPWVDLGDRELPGQGQRAGRRAPARSASSRCRP